VTKFFVFLDCGTVRYEAVQSKGLYSEGFTHCSFTVSRKEELGSSSETYVILLGFKLSRDRSVHKLCSILLIVNLFVATSLLALQTVLQ
jgi:hypothetical protein